MASSAAVPRLNKPMLPNSACVRLPSLPVIRHPMSKVGDRSKLTVSGSATFNLRRSHTVVGYPTMNIATCVSWAGDELVKDTRKKRRYRKRAMATGSKTDEEVLEILTERLVDGFDGIKRLFRTSDPVGEDCVTQDALLKIMYQTLGYISQDRFQRLLKNLDLDKKETISFDTFVSRFKEFADIQHQWTAPLKKEAAAERLTKAHPEEALRDCDIQDWAQLKVAPQATYRLMKALREKKIDFRSILPDECFVPNGVVTNIQLRVALQEIGVNLTDQEYKRFWARYDKQNLGSVPLEKLYTMMNLDLEGNPTSEPPKVQTPVILKANTSIPPRSPAKAAREFALGRHQIRGDPGALAEGIRGEGIQTPLSAGHVDSRAHLGAEEGEEKPVSPATDAAARSKIRAVMTQKPQGKFDCIVDCLHHKLEERYISMSMAFKLFDIHNDGSVMRIDFRRVLGEYGFPVTALQLGPLIQRVGMSIKHGLINYRQLLSKLMNRTDAFTSTVLDDYIMAIQEGRSGEATQGSDSDVEDIARKIVQYLHHDYAKMAAHLLRKDQHNHGVLPPDEVASAVEQCLGHGMSEVQWEDLQTKIPYDADGKVRYGDFMMSFGKGEPGAWNQLTHGTVTVPRNKVVNQPTQEVLRLERSKTEPYPVPEKAREHRPVQQLREELKAFFTENLHAVDHRFKELDRKSHKRFSKWQFGAILKLCGFPMTEKELNDVWLSLKVSDDNMSTFNAVVMEFAPNFTPFHGGKDKDTEVEEEKREEKVASRGQVRDSRNGADRADEPEVTEPLKFSPRHYLTQIVLKVEPGVRKNWEFLRQLFRNQDPHGYGTVSFQSMQRMLDNLKCGLSREERDQLCSQFDFRRSGRCNYLAFMKMFSEAPPAEPKLVYASHRHKLEKKPKDAPKPITVSEAMQRIRNKLIRHWKNLRRGFQKNDRSRSGMMTVTDFKRVLAECSVPVSEEDLYHILSEFDSNMDGLISYPEFLDALLRMDSLTLCG